MLNNKFKTDNGIYAFLCKSACSHILLFSYQKKQQSVVTLIRVTYLSIINETTVNNANAAVTLLEQRPEKIFQALSGIRTNFHATNFHALLNETTFHTRIDQVKERFVNF